MQKSIVLFALIFLASCQSQFTPANQILKDNVPAKFASASLNSIHPTSKTAEADWYSELNELDGFENYEEETGILLEGKISVGIYSHPNSRKNKVVILEALQHQVNGEAQFRKLDLIKLNLDRYQFLHTDFCSLKNDSNALILTIYEGGEEIAYAKNFVKAWQVNLQSYKLEAVPVENIICQFEF